MSFFQIIVALLSTNEEDATLVERATKALTQDNISQIKGILNHFELQLYCFKILLFCFLFYEYSPNHSSINVHATTSRGSQTFDNRHTAR